MDITLYVLLSLGLAILLLAMWACAASGVNRWGPDLTEELPPHLLREVFALRTTQKASLKPGKKRGLLPSAPSEFSCDPLLTNAYPIARSDPPPPPPRPPLRKAPPPPTPSKPVRVLPRDFVPRQKPEFSRFTMGDPA